MKMDSFANIIFTNAMISKLATNVLVYYVISAVCAYAVRIYKDIARYNNKMKKVAIVWAPTMFSFGFYRQWYAEPVMKQIPELTSSRVLQSSINGIFYVLPPYGLASIVNLADRLEIQYSGKNKMDYRGSYREMVGYNYRTF
jgi:hypothetical protein